MYGLRRLLHLPDCMQTRYTMRLSLLIFALHVPPLSSGACACTVLGLGSLHPCPASAALPGGVLEGELQDQAAL
jgi:hypothetical protein